MSILRFQVPSKLLHDSIEGLISNISGSLTHLKKNAIARLRNTSIRKYRFKMRYRPTRFLLNGTLQVQRDRYKMKVDQKSGFGSLTFFPTRFPHQVFFRMPIPPKNVNRWNALKIVLQRNKWFICFSYRTLVPVHVDDREHKSPRMVALDPGVRKFLTFYDTEGNVGTIGDRVYKALKPHVQIMGNASRRMRKLKSCWKDQKTLIKPDYKHNLSRDQIGQHVHAYEQAKRNHRRQLLRQAKKYRKHNCRIQNLRKDAHYKIANWLCRQYDHIILTRLNVKYMSKKKSGLGRSTRKAMLKLGHFQFRQILVQKASQYPGTKIYIGGEAYISKTCGQCGQLNYKLGSSEIFRCRFTSCGYKSDRDVNAARNIMLLYGKSLQKRK